MSPRSLLREDLEVDPATGGTTPPGLILTGGFYPASGGVLWECVEDRQDQLCSSFRVRMVTGARIVHLGVVSGSSGIRYDTRDPGLGAADT